MSANRIPISRSLPCAKSTLRLPSAAAAKDRSDHSAEKPAQAVDDRFQGAPGLRRREGHAGECFSRPIRIGGEGYRLATGFDHAEQGQNRNKHRDDESRRLQPSVPGPDAKPEMQADHRVSPSDDQNQHLQVAVLGNADEIEPQQVSVVTGIGVEKIVGYAGSDNMTGEQDRDRKAEDDLAQLG